MSDFFDKTLQPTLAKATTEKVTQAHHRAKARTRLAGWATVICFVAGIWVDWRFLPTAAVSATVYVFYNLLRGAIGREAERRENP